MNRLNIDFCNKTLEVAFYERPFTWGVIKNVPTRKWCNNISNRRRRRRSEEKGNQEKKKMVFFVGI